MPSRQLCSVINDLQQPHVGLVDHVGIRHTVVSHQRICGMRAAELNAVDGKQKWPKHATLRYTAWQLNTT